MLVKCSKRLKQKMEMFVHCAILAITFTSIMNFAIVL